MIVNRPFFEGPAARGVFASRLIQRVLKSALVSSSLVMIVTAVATAQEYPTRPVRLVVGFTAGGPTDVPARFIADKLSAALGKPVVVENKPGAYASGMYVLRCGQYAFVQKCQIQAIRHCTCHALLKVRLCNRSISQQPSPRLRSTRPVRQGKSRQAELWAPGYRIITEYHGQKAGESYWNEHDRDPL